MHYLYTLHKKKAIEQINTLLDEIAYAWVKQCLNRFRNVDIIMLISLYNGECIQHLR